MSRWVDALMAAALAAAALPALAQQAAFPGIGRDATTAEVKAWDIDVRPDFLGLPKGSGSVDKGQQVWEDKCASCHGVFGESNQVFNPLVGGTGKDDIASGRVSSLQRTDFPGRTTLMKVSTVSTLWDYINRAMPWNNPKTLKVDEVYAVTAYLLNLADVVPGNFTLSDQTIAQAQQRMPNRNGMSTSHGLWPGKLPAGTGKPDVTASRCMAGCAADAKVTSQLPDFARDAHGNLAQQNRLVGAQRGIDTTVAVAATAPATATATATATASGAAGTLATAAAPAAVPTAAAFTIPADIGALLQKNNCSACHATSQRVVGPSWKEVAARYPGKADQLALKIRAGGAGTWGPIPMPPQTLDDASLRQVANWLAGARP